MARRIVEDVLLGFVLQVIGVLGSVTIAAMLLGPDFRILDTGPVPEAEQLRQLQMSITAGIALMFALTFALGWILKVRNWREGATRGAIWAAVGIVVQLIFTAGSVMTLPVIWIYFSAIVAGPILAGLLRDRRRHHDGQPGEQGRVTQ